MWLYRALMSVAAGMSCGLVIGALIFSATGSVVLSNLGALGVTALCSQAMWRMQQEPACGCRRE